MCCYNFILILLALIFPPLPVWIKCGLCSMESLINIALSVLGYIPGVIHAIYIIAKYPLDPQYIIINDEERQIYNIPRTRVLSPVVIVRERVQTPSSEQLTQNNTTIPNYASTAEQPPRYSEFDTTVQKP